MFWIFEKLSHMTMDNMIWVTLLRLGVAMFCGGVIGLERGRKRRPAGFRTHMLVCIGAALAMLISQYLTMMVDAHWHLLTHFDGQKYTDASRLGAQVINGIGFLGAGTIIVTGRQEVKGLTTAAGLWASACMGLAIGAGFVEGAFVACLLISLTIIVFSRLERVIVARTRNLNLYVEFEHVDDLGKIISTIKEQNIRIFDVDVRKANETKLTQSAVFSIRLPKRMPHTKVMTVLAGLESIRTIEEL
ncbi:MAG: MgtC/SapB family protein [Ruminococcaceae bacterium]|nr:MgtC/SapB family protein [Oscillospiraceae bacterium]